MEGGVFSLLVGERCPRLEVGVRVGLVQLRAKWPVRPQLLQTTFVALLVVLREVVEALLLDDGGRR